ncbi:MAG: tRNA1(Val) (adenine(37)-N6)-methyltransferase [Solirubrobacterales bacterium]
MRKPTGESVETQDRPETLDDLYWGLQIFQPARGYRYAMDSVLLADFSAPCNQDRILDLGCGSGVISLLIGSRAKGSRVVGIEIQESLAQFARRSVRWNQLSESIQILTGDLKQIGHLIPQSGMFSLVVFNPPYYRAGQGRHSPNEEIRCARHEISATLGDFVAAADHALAPQGRICAVLPAARENEMKDRLEQSHFAITRLRRVIDRPNRAPMLVLIEAKRRLNVKTDPIEIPPLVVHAADGVETPEIRQIYRGGRD